MKSISLGGKMSREKEFVKNTIILSIGRLLPKLTSFITLPILTACLTKEEYGTYDLITTLIMLVIPIATLQIQSAAFRFLIDCRGQKENASVIISNIFVVTIPISILASIIVQSFFFKYSASIRVAVAAYFFLDTLNLTVGQVTRGLGYNKDYSAGAIILSIVNMIGIVFTVYFGKQGLFGVLISLVCAQTIGIIYRSIRIHLGMYFNFGYISLNKIKELLMYSWPMVPNNLSNWVLKLSDRLVITTFLGLEANALYAVANKIPNLLSIGQQILVMAWQENASIVAGDKDADTYYSKMLDRTFNAMFGLTALLIAFVPVMFELLIKGDYRESYDQIPILILATFFFVMSSYFGGIYVAHKRTTSIGISTMAAAGINLLIDLLFVKVIGIWAGSISTLVAYLLLYFFRMIDSRKFQKIDVNLKKQILLIFILVVMLFLCFLQNSVTSIINIFFGILFCGFSNRDLLETVFQRVKKRA